MKIGIGSVVLENEERLVDWAVIEGKARHQASSTLGVL